jgi:hypothetical protein
MSKPGRPVQQGDRPDRARDGQVDIVTGRPSPGSSYWPSTGGFRCPLPLAAPPGQLPSRRNRQLSRSSSVNGNRILALTQICDGNDGRGSYLADRFAGYVRIYPLVGSCRARMNGPFSCQ